MDNQQAVVDQIVQNLAFEVEAVPKNKSIQANNISQSTPLNVKIKVRKKDEIQKYHNVSWNTDDTPKTVQKVRLVNSDQTIMTFDVFMEAKFDKKPRKLHKQLFDMLRPGICLGAVDDDKNPYMPSSSYSANITEPTKATKSDGTLKQTFTLSKNVYQVYTVSTQQRGSKWLFGKCKPGGCLDPPFSEDKYSYKPSTRSGPEREEEDLLDEENIGSDVNSTKKPITLHDEETRTDGRHGSIFDNGLFNKKRRSSDKSTDTKLPDKTDSIVDIYHEESSTNPSSTRSNSIITYPPKTKSVSRKSDDKTVSSRGPSEDKLRSSFNDHSEPYYIPPKGVNRIKEKDTLDPIPIMSSTRKPEDIDPNNDILATQGDNVTELPKKELQGQELAEKMKLRGLATPQLLRKESTTGYIDNKAVESSKMESFTSNVEQPTTRNELGDKNMGESKLQPFEEIDIANNMEVNGPPNKNEKLESPMPLPIPIPVPFNLSDSAAAMDSKAKKENLKITDMDLAQSKQSFKTPITKEKHFEDSKDMQKNKDPENRSIQNESTSNATPKPQYSDTEADAIPKDFLRTRSGFEDQESDTENQESDKVGDKGNDLGSLLSGSKTSTASAKDKRDPNNSGSPDKHSDKLGDKGTDLSSLLSGSKISTPPPKHKRDIKRDDSLDEHPEKVGEKGIDLGSLLSASKTTTASARDKRETKRGDSPDKHSDKVGHKGTDLGSLLRGSKTSTASAKDKRETKRGDSPDKHLDIVGDKGTDLGSLLSGSKASTASAKDIRETKRGDSPDKHSDKVGAKGTDLGSLLSESKILTVSAEDKRDTKRGDSPDKHSENVRDKRTDLGSLLSGSKTSTASAKDKRDTKRGDSPDKHLDIVGDKGTDLGSLLRGSKSSTASAIDRRETKRFDSPDKHSDKVGAKGTDLRSLLSESKILTVSAKDKRDTMRGDSPDKHSENVRDKRTDLGSLLSGSKTSTTSAEDKRETKRGDSPDKHSDKVGDKGTDLGSLLRGSKTSTASAKDKRDTKRGDSQDKHLDIVGDKGTDLGSFLSGSKSSTASAKDRRETKRGDSPDKHSDKVGAKGTDLGSLLSESKILTVSAEDKRDTKRGDSPDKHSENVRDKRTDLGSLLSGSKTSTASAKDKRETKRGDSPDKHLDIVGDKGTDLGSLLSGSKSSTASAKDKRDTMRGDSPDKHSENVRDKRTDLGSLLSGSKTSTTSAVDKRDPNRSDSPDKHSKNDSNIDSYTKSQARFPNEEYMNFIAAPVIIDYTKASPKSEKLKEADSDTKILNGPINIDREYDPSEISFTTQVASIFRESDGDDETQSTVSHELIGTQSAIYDTDELSPSTSGQKYTERISQSDKLADSSLPIHSTSTLKSAMKTNLISVELGFHSYLNDKNDRILKTFDAANLPTRLSNDSVTVLKTQIKISSNEIRIPVDSEHDMSIKIKKSNANQRVSISESGFMNNIDNSTGKKQRFPVLSSDAEIRSSKAEVEERKEKRIETDATVDHFTEYYEQELVPLQQIIKNLRNEIDVLAAQQVKFKDKLFCPNNALCAQNKSKLPRLVHSNKKCYGCVRK